jgi:hypothetical protein
MSVTYGRRKWRWMKWISVLLVATLLLESLPLVAAPALGGFPVAPALQGNPTLQDCSTVAEDTLQSELNVVTQQVFAGALANVNLDTIVARHWVTLEMDAAVGAAVDLAVARVQTETDIWNQFLSGWSPDMAQQLTLAVATYTFDAPPFRAKMDELSAAVSQDVADQLAVASADSASAALYCLQTFIGRNYSQALVNAFEERVQVATSSASLVNSDELSPDILQLVGEHQLALGGIGVIIVAQITRKIVTSIAQRISQRVAGRIVGRVLGKAGSTVIPIAGWVIGTGMIAYDLWDSREGALPQIRTALKSPEVAAGVRTEIAASIRPELEAEIPNLARTIANDLFVEWRNTKRTIRQVLDLAAANPQFGAILGGLASSAEVARLVDLVGIVQANGGDAALQAAIADGTLAAAANLPPGAVTIAAENGSLQSALAWYNAVGSRLDDVVALELYKGRTPDSVDINQLDKLIALGDKSAVARLGLLAPADLDALLSLPHETVLALAEQLPPDDLAWLGTVLPTVTREQANALVARILSQPAVVEPLRRLGDLSQVLAGRSLDSAITFVAGPKGMADFWTDGGAALLGTVPAGLFVAKHGGWAALGAVMLLLLLALIALRLLFGLGQWLVAPLSILRGKR